MRQDVHGQGGHGDVHLTAHVALLGVVRVKAAMRLLVSRQIWAGGIILAAFRACIARFGFFTFFRINGGDGWGCRGRTVWRRSFFVDVLLTTTAVAGEKGLISVGGGLAIVHGKSGGCRRGFGRSGRGRQGRWQEWGRCGLTSCNCGRFDIGRGSGRVSGGGLAEVQNGVCGIDIFDVSILQRRWGHRVVIGGLGLYSVLQAVRSEQVFAWIVVVIKVVLC